MFARRPRRCCGVAHHRGSTITGIVMNVVANYLFAGMDLTAATDAPRVISRNEPTLLEAALISDAALVRALVAMGYNVTGVCMCAVRDGRVCVVGRLTDARAGSFGDRPLGAVQSVARLPDGRLTAVADTTRMPMAAAGGL